MEGHLGTTTDRINAAHPPAAATLSALRLPSVRAIVFMGAVFIARAISLGRHTRGLGARQGRVALVGLTPAG